MILIDVLKLGLIIRAVAGMPATYTGLSHHGGQAPNHKLRTKKSTKLKTLPLKTLKALRRAKKSVACGADPPRPLRVHPSEEGIF
jgi:hypothetical protein